MTPRLLHAMAVYIRDRDLRDVNSFLNEVLCDMRRNDHLALRMYDMFFKSEQFRSRVKEYLTLQRADSLNNTISRLAYKIDILMRGPW